jgi:hypothetical protein
MYWQGPAHDENAANGRGTLHIEHILSVFGLPPAFSTRALACKSMWYAWFSQMTNRGCSDFVSSST